MGWLAPRHPVRLQGSSSAIATFSKPELIVFLALLECQLRTSTNYMSALPLSCLLSQKLLFLLSFVKSLLLDDFLKTSSFPWSPLKTVIETYRS